MDASIICRSISSKVTQRGTQNTQWHPHIDCQTLSAWTGFLVWGCNYRPIKKFTRVKKATARNFQQNRLISSKLGPFWAKNSPFLFIFWHFQTCVFSFLNVCVFYFQAVRDACLCVFKIFHACVMRVVRVREHALICVRSHIPKHNRHQSGF